MSAFETEPACWHPNNVGGWLKPDAYLKLSTDTLSDHWWLEVDKGTEHLPTIRRKLLTYMDFADAGGLGPRGVLPRVLITVPNEARRAAIAGLIERTPEAARNLSQVIDESHAAGYLLQVLRH